MQDILICAFIYVFLFVFVKIYTSSFPILYYIIEFLNRQFPTDFSVPYVYIINIRNNNGIS